MPRRRTCKHSTLTLNLEQSAAAVDSLLANYSITDLEQSAAAVDSLLANYSITDLEQSAAAVDSALDPQRHKGVDALNAKVGR